MLTHGKSQDRIYGTWSGMVQRCTNPNNERYHRYGGRGIKVYDKWLTFEGFYEDMGEPPEGKTLDRIDNDGNYEPSNCRWATPTEQANNKYDTIELTYQGKTQTLYQWGIDLGIKQHTLYTRVRRGWVADRILTTPLQAKDVRIVKAFAEQHGISIEWAYKRMAKERKESL